MARTSPLAALVLTVMDSAEKLFLEDCKLGRRDKVRAALIRGQRLDVVDADDAGKSPLHHAAENGHVDVAKLLITRGADIEAEDRWQGRPLDLACANGHMLTVRLLLYHGAKIEANYFSALHYAAPHEAVLRLLLDYGGRSDHREENGATALIVAAESGYVDTLEVLLFRRADKEAVDEFGRTALHCAAENGHGAAAQVLLDYGANALARTLDGRLPSDMAGTAHGKVPDVLLAAEAAARSGAPTICSSYGGYDDVDGSEDEQPPPPRRSQRLHGSVTDSGATDEEETSNAAAGDRRRSSASSSSSLTRSHHSPPAPLPPHPRPQPPDQHDEPDPPYDLRKRRRTA